MLHDGIQGLAFPNIQYIAAVRGFLLEACRRSN
jgi:hypothetical protein